MPATMTMMEATLLLQNMNLAELHALASFSGLQNKNNKEDDKNKYLAGEVESWEAIPHVL
jgi:hypothetical protein